MKRILIACLTTTLAATTMLAQGWGGRGEGRGAPGTDAIQEALTLSADQVAALQQNNQEMRDAMRALFEEGKAHHEALKAELENTNPNPTTVGQLVIDAKVSREKGEALRAEYHDKALAILNATQQSALTTLAESAERSPALREAAALNLLDGPRGGFGKGMDHGPRRGGFRGGRG